MWLQTAYAKAFFFFNFPEINNKEDILLISHDEHS